jgi:serine protease Do
MVVNIAKALINDGKFVRAYLGVSISDISEDLSGFYGRKFGALVTGIADGTPAEKLGLKRGDLIIKVDDKEVESASSLKNIISSITPDTKVTITYLRDKKQLQGVVKLTSYKDDNNGFNNTTGKYQYKGLSVEPLTQNLKNSLGISSKVSGVFVSQVDANSEASQSGIRKGDIIVQVEHNEIQSIDNFKKSVQGTSKKRLYIMRRGGIYVVAL